MAEAVLEEQKVGRIPKRDKSPNHQTQVGMKKVKPTEGQQSRGPTLKDVEMTESQQDIKAESKTVDSLGSATEAQKSQLVVDMEGTISQQQQDKNDARQEENQERSAFAATEEILGVTTNEVLTKADLKEEKALHAVICLTNVAALSNGPAASNEKEEC
jgi:hypothetical protein